ncbi:hypothetical protein FDP41_001305 [Naegleria fowleri]|uniref:Uncharacterized protein n=1 Tax=Naegleria fowleri TaxID=5763 RepID=A0A6A5BR54_NAEFO|nr:uncharacterized protein FDP41_001305 [Naegleria fowleri]KAF0979637.1 hypothetical protein FDP41_001305 [Naegleria fowleri]
MSTNQEDLTQRPNKTDHDDDIREPFYIYLQNSELNTNLQKYISAFVQHIASILEQDAPNVRRIVSFLPERNGVLLFGFRRSTIKVLYSFLKSLDQKKHNINFEINLVLVESHKMTHDFNF